jgi:hypothetical protein
MLHILILKDVTYTYTQGCYIYLYSRMLHILILKDATYTYTQECYIYLYSMMLLCIPKNVTISIWLKWPLSNPPINWYVASRELQHTSKESKREMWFLLRCVAIYTQICYFIYFIFKDATIHTLICIRTIRVSRIWEIFQYFQKIKCMTTLKEKQLINDFHLHSFLTD